jgi:hypothetical protein
MIGHISCSRARLVQCDNDGAPPSRRRCAAILAARSRHERHRATSPARRGHKLCSLPRRQPRPARRGTSSGPHPRGRALGESRRHRIPAARHGEFTQEPINVAIDASFVLSGRRHGHSRGWGPRGGLGRPPKAPYEVASRNNRRPSPCFARAWRTDCLERGATVFRALELRGGAGRRRRRPGCPPSCHFRCARRCGNAPSSARGSRNTREW